MTQSPETWTHEELLAAYRALAGTLPVVDRPLLGVEKGPRVVDDPRCPYCGEQDNLYLKGFRQIDDRIVHFIQCGNRTCHSQGPKSDSEVGAIEAFKKRVSIR